MARSGRQTELIDATERQLRDITLSKPTRVRYTHAAAHRDVSPEIRSVRKKRIRFGSVAPLLSRRAKALALVRKCD